MELFNDTERWAKFVIPAHTKDWFDFRTIGYKSPDGRFYPGGLGASEVSKLFHGVNQYSPVLQAVYYHKIGMEVPDKFQNENTFWGTMDEPGVIHAWQFWDGGEASYVDNYQKWVEGGQQDKHLIRKAVPCKYYLVNRKYPWLFASLDSAIPPGSPNMITGEPLVVAAPLEAKTIGYYAGKNWVDKVPYYHIIQLNQQMIVTESDYGEIVLKRDGQKLDVKYYERNEALCNQILSLSHDFWNNRVLPARRLYKEMMQAEAKQNLDLMEKLHGQIQGLEPEPDSSEAYAAYQAAKHQSDRNYMRGGPKLYSSLKKIVYVKTFIKKLKAIQTQEENIVRDALIKNMVDEAVFEHYGYFRYSKHGDGKRLRSELRGELDEAKVESQIDKLDLYL